MMVDLDLVQMHIQSVSFGVRIFQKYSVVQPGLSDGIETPFVIYRSTKDAGAAERCLGSGADCRNGPAQHRPPAAQPHAPPTDANIMSDTNRASFLLFTRRPQLHLHPLLNHHQESGGSAGWAQL